MAVVAYALQRTNHRDKDNAFSKLKTMRRIGKNVFLYHGEYTNGLSFEHHTVCVCYDNYCNIEIFYCMK